MSANLFRAWYWVIILISTLSLKAQAEFSVVWTNTFISNTGLPDNQVVDAILDREGSLYITGGVGSNTVKYTKEGELAWVKPLAGANLALMPDGDLIVLGEDATRLHPDGSMVWQRAKPFGSNVVGRLSRVDSNGMLTVLVNRGFWVFRLSSDGRVEWDVNVQEGLEGAALAMALGPSGEVAVTGLTLLDEGSSRTLTVHINSEGKLSWARTYEGGSNSGGRSVVFNSAGNVLVGGTQDRIQPGDQRTIARTIILDYNSVGAERLLATFRSALDPRRLGSEGAVSISAAPDGALYLVASASSGERNTALIKFDPDGRRIWSKFLSGAITQPPLIRPDGSLLLTTHPGISVVSSNGSLEFFYSITATAAGNAIPVQRLFVAGDDLYFASTLQFEIEAGVNGRAYFAGRLKNAPIHNLPKILSSLKDQISELGSDVILHVEAKEEEPSGTGLFYQWRFEGSTLDGATNSTLRVGHLGAESSGWYSVLVTNTRGSVESSDSLIAATIKLQPAASGETGKSVFSFRAQSNYVYGIEISTNLTTWREFKTLVATDSVVQVFDPEPTGSGGRFFRVLPEFRQP
jgi:hypothetical protein